jgi:NAD(P)-dependent dehydrogenase (short-subunit alcohol dehydrogenase family)
VIADINYPAAKAFVDKLTQQGSEALATQTDVSVVAQTQEMVDKTLERFGRIDILVNNAAMFQRKLAIRSLCWEMDPADFERVIKVNVTGVFLCCRAVLPHMIKQKSGKIINIASSLAFLGAPTLTHYSASKGAVVTFTRALAREVGEYGINVNSLCPGFTLSADPASITEDRRQYEVSSRILKRPEYPEDLVGTAVYLASADSDFMTGQAVVVDGGVVLH